MTTDTDQQGRADKRADQMDEIYRTLGRVVVEFSLLMGGMDTSMRLSIGNDEADRYAEGPAKALTDKFFRVGEELNHWQGQDAVVVTALHAQVVALLHRRNRMFHDYWFVGWGNDQTINWSEAMKVQVARLRAGQEPQTVWKAIDIEAFADEVAEHAAMIRHLGAVMCAPQWAAGFPPSANLAFDANGGVHSRGTRARLSPRSSPPMKAVSGA